MSDDVSSAPVEVLNCGQIERMKLPPGWQANQKQEGKIGNSSYRDYTPPDNKEVKMVFFYRGRPVEPGSASAFHGLLEKPAHSLSPAELKSIAEVIRDRQDARDFQMLSARTEDLNGKRVLIVEGRYIQIQQDTYAVLVDADGSGKAVQEIFFQAPKENYMRFSREAKESIKSIQWKI